MAQSYGLPKIRKTDVLLHPIVAFNNTPTYSPAKWTSKTLKPLTETSLATVKATTSFLRRIQDLTIADDEVMVSFDVVSLSTSIAQDLSCMAIRQLLESGHNNMSLTTGEMMTLLEFCLNTVFMFDGKMYQQVKGTSRGSPLPRVIAEAILQKYEKEVLPQCPP